jgi:hypothetical protein
VVLPPWIPGYAVSGLNDERDEIAGKLNAAGVVTSVDPQCQVPAVLVGAPSVIGSEGVGGWACEYPIQIMGVPPGDLPALTWMLEQLEKVLTVYFGPSFPRTLDHGGKDVPAYVVTVTRSVSNPNC